LVAGALLAVTIELLAMIRIVYTDSTIRFTDRNAANDCAGQA